MATAQRAAQGGSNGTAPEQQIMADAIAYEQRIADEAARIWGESNAPTMELTPRLFFRLLRPLLRRPIPLGYIEHVGVVQGKPYESTGVRSVQVQMDRLDNVLCPQNWGYERTFMNGGKLCEVVAWVGRSRDEALFIRDSFGGVKQGSTEGNIFKGAFTNAAKTAFARLGPGWEVYVGAADFDPDTDADAAKAQQQAPAEEKDPNRPLSEAAVSKLRDELAKKQIPPQEVSMRLRGFGADALEALTAEQGVAFWAWLNDWKASANG